MEIENLKILFGDNRIEEFLEMVIEQTTGVLLTPLGRSAQLLKLRLQQFRDNEINGIEDKQELMRINDACLKLMAKIVETISNVTELQIAFNDNLLAQNSLPFAGRTTFRNLLREAFESNDSSMIFVNATGQPGLSYLEKYLNHINKNNTFRLIPFPVRSLVESPDPFKAVLLAKHLSISLNIAINFNEEEGDQFKFRRFSTKLRESLENQQQSVIFFLDDFHHFKPLPPNDLKRFLEHFIAEIPNRFPKCIFIIAGFKNEELLPNWFSELEFLSNFKDCKLETITRDNFRDCLHHIYHEYQREIEIQNKEPVTESEYVEGMLQLITSPDSPQFDIRKAAFKISTSLKTLKAIPQ